MGIAAGAGAVRAAQAKCVIRGTSGYNVGYNVGYTGGLLLRSAPRRILVGSSGNTANITEFPLKSQLVLVYC